MLDFFSIFVDYIISVKLAFSFITVDLILYCWFCKRWYFTWFKTIAPNIGVSSPFCIFLNESYFILMQISLKFVPRGSIYNMSALAQVMALRRTGDKPSSEQLCGLLTPQWVKWILLKTKQLNITPHTTLCKSPRILIPTRNFAYKSVIRHGILFIYPRQSIFRYTLKKCDVTYYKRNICRSLLLHGSAMRYCIYIYHCNG